MLRASSHITSSVRAWHCLPPVSCRSRNARLGCVAQQRKKDRKKESKTSQLDSIIRNTPILNRFYDGTLLFGDCVMLLATEVSSERIPWDSLPVLVGVMMCSWIVTSATLGDYKGTAFEQPDIIVPFFNLDVFWAVVNATITWAAAIIVAFAAYSLLISHNLVDSELIVNNSEGGASAQLEVTSALLITMSCWRGIVAKLRL